MSALVERLVERWLQEVGYLGANDDVRRDARFFMRAIADELEASVNGERFILATEWLREQAAISGQAGEDDD